MSLKLISNVGQPKLEGVGSIRFIFRKIVVSTEPFCKATVFRNNKTVTLCETQDKKTSISGVPKTGDVYTIEKGLEKLVVTVEEEKENKIKAIFVRDNLVDESNSQNRKTTLTVGVILLVLLIVSVTFGIKQKNNRDFEKQSLIKLDEAVSNYDSSVAGVVDKNSARELFISSKKIAFELKEAGFKNEKLEELIKNITEKEAEIVGEVKVEVKEFLDLTLQTSGFNGSQMVSSGEEIFIFDKENKNIIKIGIKNKNAKIAANKEDIGDTKSIASYEDRLLLDKLDGVYEVEENSLFYIYAGNIYIIDKSNNQIYRHSGSGKTFGQKAEWLAPSVEVDFSKVIDMTIDGSIWLLSSSGKVSKFTLGNPQTVSLSGLNEPFTNPTAIYTNEKLKNVYILEKDKGRVVAIDKSGEFKLQYLNDEIKNAKDIVVSEEEGKIILLTGPKLMYIELK
ncbi:MAG: hypothetical protein Q8Q30_02700 [Candidatus Woesebacteria bacterium]|nr:hypothetical protein [Candidatus Woesebacteria bacterium]